MGKLEELLEKFRNDKSWNEERPDGSHRFDKEIAWIESMIKDYAEKLNLTTDRVVEIMEGKRDYSWPNYYQPANFPGIDSSNLVGVFETFQAFHEHAKKEWKGFRCPKCGDISNHPQECAHRISKDGKCDWCSYGLFKSGTGVIILEDGLKAIPIFEPVAKDGDADG
ncbi:MAG: hypothetical protein IJE16_06010 [Ruminococcus sp.]|nr:hypothetical protein [Ruminococcus sp.]